MSMQLLTATEYVTQATRAIQQAQKRVHVIAMVIADHDATHDFITALQDAAKRGVTACILI